MLAALVPTLAMSYTIVGLVLACAGIFAKSVVSSALFQAPLAGWTIWISIAISVRARDIRTAQQLAGLASLVPAGVTALMSFRVIPQNLSVPFEPASRRGNGWLSGFRQPRCL